MKAQHDPQGDGFEICQPIPDDIPRIADIHQVTRGPRHHFCNYYGISPWDASGRRLLCLETDLTGREVEADDRAQICLIDLETGTCHQVAHTATWNLQQGALAQWRGPDRAREIVFNDCLEGRLEAVVLDVDTGRRTMLPRPLAGIAHSGKIGASISYARLRWTRPGYGYAHGEDPSAKELHPENDGLHIIDLETGRHELIVPIGEIFEAYPLPQGLEKKPMWFNHVVFSHDDSRVFFLARVMDDTDRIVSSAFTVNPDGTDLRQVIPYAWLVSHFDWLDGPRLLVTTKFEGREPWRHVLFTDGQDDYTVLCPSLLDHDGHGCFSPDRRWLVTDAYPDEDRMHSLLLVNLATGQGAKVAQLFSPPDYTGPWRCDLHPRWNATSNKLCIDSACDGTRQVYIADLHIPGE